MGTTGLKDLLMVFILLFGDNFETVGFLPQSPALLPLILWIFPMCQSSGDKAKKNT